MSIDLSGTVSTAVLEQLTEGVIITDAEGCITFVNEAARRIHGVAELGVRIDAYTAVYHLLTMEGEPYSPQELPLARAVLRGETVDRALWRIRRPDGVEVIAQGSALPLTTPDGARRGAVLLVRDVTREHAVEQALQQSHEQYRTLAEAVPHIVYSALPDGTSDYLNTQWYEYTGTKSGDDIYATWHAALHPDDLERATDAWRNSLETGEPLDVEYRLRGTDGTYRWFLARGVPQRDSEGRIIRWFGTATTIDRQKREEEKQRFLVRLFEETRILADPDEVMWTAMRLLGDHLHASRSAYNEVDEKNDLIHAQRDYCTEGDSILGTSPLSSFGPALLDDLRAGRTAVITDSATDSRTASAFETTYQHLGIRSFIAAPILKQGRLVSVLSVNMAAPRAWTEDEVELVDEVAERTWLAIQITAEAQERRRAETALRAAEAQLRLVTDAAPLLISYVDSEQRFRFNNQTYATWFGRPLEDLTGKHVREVLGEVAYEGIREYIACALAGQTIRFEQEMPYQSTGHRYVQITFVPHRGEDAGVKGFVAVVNDLSDRKLAEQALHASEARFRMLAEQSPLSIQILSPDGRTLRVNRAWEQLWGVTLEDLRDYNMLQDRQLVDKGIMPYIERAFAGEAVSIPPVLYDTDQTLPDRTSNADPKRWTQAFMYPIKDEAGGIREIVLIHEDITERRRTEEALRETDKRIRLIADNAPAYISNIDVKFRYVFANRACAKRFDLSPEEMVGKTVEEVMGREAFKAIRPYMERTFRGETLSYELAIPYEPLGTRYMQVFYAPDFAEDGTVCGLVAVVHDITERNDADNARAYLAAIVHSSEDAIVSKDLNGIITSWNPAAERIYGYTAEEIIGRSKSLVIPPELPDELQTILGKIRAGERIANYETLRIRKDGKRVNLSITVSPIRDINGQIIGASTIARDITEQIRVEEERAQLTLEVVGQRKRLDDLISSVPGVVWETWRQPDRGSQRINFVSEHVETMLGYTVKEWVALPDFWLTIVHPEDREKAMRVAGEAWASGRQHVNEFRWIRKDGQTLWCESHSVVVHDANGVPIGMRGVTIDVSERKRLEMRLREETRTLETIHDIGRRLSAELDLEKIVQAATDAATQLTGAQFGAFFYNVVTPAGESYMLNTISGVPREAFSRFPMPRNTAVFAPTFAGEATVRLDDVTKDPRYGQNAPYHGMPPGHLPVVSYLAVPAVSRSGEVLGGLFFGHEQPGVFTERHERLVKGLTAQAAIAIDNARLFQAERERSEQLAIAVREVHHRVKNSLQGVSALLEMQMMPDATTLPVEVIRDSLSQIKTIALVHDLLAHDKPIGKVDVAQVLSKLISMLAVMLGRPERPLPIRLDAVSVWIPIRPAIALALVINELVTNAAKHSTTGIADGSEGHEQTIYVTLQQQQDDVRVSVQDGGPGFPPDFDPLLHAHIGLELVQALVSNDLKGSISYNVGADRNGEEARLERRGARAEITFSANLTD